VVKYFSEVDLMLLGQFSLLENGNVIVAIQ